MSDEGLSTRCDRLLGAARRLLAAYEQEEWEHGFPFNFELREAHEAVRAIVEECR